MLVEWIKTFGFWYFVGAGMAITTLLLIKLWYIVFEKIVTAKIHYGDYLLYILNKDKFEKWLKANNDN